jgi:hypothetical protein
MTGERQSARAGGTAWVAADDGSPHRVVEAAGKDDSDQRGTAVARGERERLRPLSRREESSPPVGFERLGEDKKQPRGGEQSRLPVRQRPGRRGEMASGQQGQNDDNGARACSERPTALSRAVQAHECSQQ